MQPRLYLRPNVRIQDLTPDTLKGLSKASKIFYKYNQPFAVTCTSTKNPMTGLEPPNHRIFGVEQPESAAILILKECRLKLGEDWKIENKKTYWRFEYNPKPLEGTPL